MDRVHNGSYRQTYETTLTSEMPEGGFGDNTDVVVQNGSVGLNMQRCEVVLIG